jgi:hypothetical protein
LILAISCSKLKGKRPFLPLFHMLPNLFPTLSSGPPDLNLPFQLHIWSGCLASVGLWKGYPSKVSYGICLLRFDRHLLAPEVVLLLKLHDGIVITFPELFHFPGQRVIRLKHNIIIFSHVLIMFSLHQKNVLCPCHRSNAFGLGTSNQNPRLRNYFGTKALFVGRPGLSTPFV